MKTSNSLIFFTTISVLYNVFREVSPCYLSHVSSLILYLLAVYASILKLCSCVSALSNVSLHCMFLLLTFSDPLSFLNTQTLKEDWGIL